VLINIGNTFNNQVPSKIFDYFALCKPVLNIEKIADCPAREYFERYPHVFNINEHQLSGCDISSLSEFVKSSKNNSIDYSTVESLFSDCTLTYATNVFCDIINKI